jgi:predicted MPP superfamily phosphohydrolase
MLKKKYSRREILKMGLFALTSGAAMTSGGYGYASKLEPNWIEVNRLELTLPNLSLGFDGITLTQISDIHLGGWMNRKRLSRVVDLVNELDSNLVAITGDFVSTNPEHLRQDLTAELSRIKAEDGVYASMGNHDHWTNVVVVRQIVKASGIKELKNDHITLQRGKEQFHLCGVDDYWEKHADAEKVVKNMPAEGCAVLMAHEPDYADISAETGRFDLQISGHSHGGQVVLPFIGPPVIPSYAEKYPLGIYKVKEMIQYTNRGAGMIKPYVRFNCRPEITVFALHSP